MNEWMNDYRPLLRSFFSSFWIMMFKNEIKTKNNLDWKFYTFSMKFIGTLYAINEKMNISCTKILL